VGSRWFCDDRNIYQFSPQTAARVPKSNDHNTSLIFHHVVTSLVPLSQALPHVISSVLVIIRQSNVTDFCLLYSDPYRIVLVVSSISSFLHFSIYGQRYELVIDSHD
jgi:hypothetical protein